MGNDSERRGAHRFVNGQPCFEATLQIGRTELPAAILDESASGFSVLVEQDPGVRAGDVLRLRTGTSHWEVRVAYLAAAGKATESCGYRLGLERVRDLATEVSPTEKGPWIAESQPIMPGYSMAGALLFIIVLLAAAPLIVLGVVLGLDETSLKQWGNWAGAGTGPTQYRSWTSPLRRFLPGKAESSSSQDVPGASSRTEAGAPEGEQFRSFLAHLRGADALLAPEVARQLTLRPDQQRQLQDLTAATNRALEQFDQYARRDTRDERVRKRELLFREARQEALQILTPEQRARWEALQGP